MIHMCIQNTACAKVNKVVYDICPYAMLYHYCSHFGTTVCATSKSLELSMKTCGIHVYATRFVVWGS